MQVWFQMRRQDQRRSRPLLPCEIGVFSLGGMALSTDPASCIARIDDLELERDWLLPAIAPIYAATEVIRRQLKRSYDEILETGSTSIQKRMTLREQ
jgi:hypothetical protein